MTISSLQSLFPSTFHNKIHNKIDHTTDWSSNTIQDRSVNLYLTLPIAKSPLSKKKTTPKKVNRTPNPVSPIPISVPTHSIPCLAKLSSDQFWTLQIIWIQSRPVTVIRENPFHTPNLMHTILRVDLGLDSQESQRACKIGYREQNWLGWEREDLYFCGRSSRNPPWRCSAIQKAEMLLSPFPPTKNLVWWLRRIKIYPRNNETLHQGGHKWWDAIIHAIHPRHGSTHDTQRQNLDQTWSSTPQATHSVIRNNRPPPTFHTTTIILLHVVPKHDDRMARTSNAGTFH